MGRLPFDPSKMQGPERPAPTPTAAAGEGAAISVGELAARVKSSLDAGLPGPVRVIGEISGFSDRTHWYFALKDATAVINCVMFASSARKAGFTPAHGAQVVVRGRIDFYAPQGKVTLIVERMEPVGQGAREAALKALIEEARQLGWLAPERKRALPTIPRNIAVVTSATGAALQDVLVTMRKRCPGVGVTVVDVRVQGDRTVPEVVRALTYLSAHADAMHIDAILLTRGGGSAEDLWAFNDRAVAEAIVTCTVPVVAAIGHETDTCLAELVADERCATPTQAAMRLTPDAAALRRQVLSIESRLVLLLSRVARHERHRLLLAARGLHSNIRARLMSARSRSDELATRLARRSPAAVHARTAARVEAAFRSLGSAIRARIDRARPDALPESLARALRERLRAGALVTESLVRQLDSVSPLRVLDRGYSVTLRSDGRVVRFPADVGPGEAIQTRVAQGVVRSVVWETTEAPPLRDTSKPTRPKTKPAGPTGPGLFE